MVDLDVKDLKLLCWLDQNSRASNKQLGKKVGLTEQAIGYKLKRLEEKGIIKKYVTFINTISLGYSHYKVFIKLHNVDEKKEDEIIDFLKIRKDVRWIVSTSGKYDLSFSVLAKSPKEFLESFSEIENKFGKNIVERNIVINVNSPGFTRDWLINKKESREIKYSSSEKTYEFDNVEHKILKTISQNARMNVVEIANKTNLSVDVVHYRLKKLKQEKIISGFTIQIDLSKIGYEYYSVFLNMNGLNEQMEKKLHAFARYHPNVLFVVKVIGNYDFQLEIEVKGHEELDLVLRDLRQEFVQNLRDFEVLRVKQEYKYDFFPF